MANIYDIARIASGDPMANVQQRAKEADARLAQWEHQKEIVEEINAAIAEAERKAKKNKEGFGLGGSLLGGLLGTGLGVLTGGMAPLLMSVAGAGLGAGAAEKIRQGEWLGDITGREKATKELEELKGKLKGRKQESIVEEDIKEIEANLDEMVMSDAENAMLSALIFQGIQKGVDELMPAEAAGAKAAEAGEKISSDWTHKFKNIYGKTKDLGGTTTGPFGITQPVAREAMSGMGGGDILSGMMKSSGLGGLDSLAQEALQKQWIQSLGRFATPSILDALSGYGIPEQRRYGVEPFRNPFRRGR
tara:strand:- start:272 stop:1186 length:915 start_codon:yes stop_codon:yes gene_type:complete